MVVLGHRRKVLERRLCLQSRPPLALQFALAANVFFDVSHCGIGGFSRMTAKGRELSVAFQRSMAAPSCTADLGQSVDLARAANDRFHEAALLRGFT